MLDVNTTKQWLITFNQLIQANKAYLSELDTPIGDGDHGGNMARGMDKVIQIIDTTEFDQVADLFKKVAMTLISSVGGASGPLYGTAFMEMAKVSKESTDIIALLSAGLAGIQKRGKVTIGEKTMVDVWAPAIELFGKDELTEESIQSLVEATKPIRATKGRASYLGDRSINHIDPGSQSSGYLLTALIRTI
ncbi:dihydroxyacetone kinase subunit DhaL [Atopobacter phocae]|uniref:dihydroxyacetone kinase subunit DhaL n=1 Tax=Atopobacter phocae TaxID=136492 RepID=UPI00046EA556|nr:dihydroxyacetone kinase subunit DhaL [Atopobacter phocae]